jgi:hypothetical protein
MIHDTDNIGENRFRRLYCWFIFDECLDPKCNKVRHVDDGVKMFSIFKLAWRHLTNSSQFICDESLFERANLIAQKVTPVLERMRMFELEQAERAKRLGKITLASLSQSNSNCPVPDKSPLKRTARILPSEQRLGHHPGHHVILLKTVCK